MPGCARKEIFDPEEVGVYFCTSRCVRRAFLCGEDNYSGKNYDHRKLWMEELLQYMARYFALDIISHSIMSNHFHITLRNRPDIVKTWGDYRVAEHWLRLYPKDRDKEGKPCEPKLSRIRALAKDKKRIAKLRQRLSSISWFHAYLKEKIARRSNLEDEASGAFWAARFQSIRLFDIPALVAASVYVDLNWIRARMAETPETSRHCSVWFRIAARQARRRAARGAGPQAVTSATGVAADGWLAPLYEGKAPENERFAACGLRISDTPGLPVSLDQYLQLVDWTGRQLRRGKRGKIPAHLADILQRLDVETSVWLDGIEHFEQWFHRAAGRARAMMEKAKQAGRRWFHGLGRCRQLFTPAEE